MDQGHDYADVWLPLPLDNPFTYKIPAPLNVTPFERVLVPFRNEKRVGIIARIHSSPPSYKLKNIEAKMDDLPLFGPSYFEWLSWASRYYMVSLGEVIATALPQTILNPKITKALDERQTRKSPFENHWSLKKEIELSPQQNEICSSLLTLLDQEKFFVGLIHGVTGSGKTEIYIHLIEHLLKKGRQVIFLVPEIGLTPQVVARFQAHFGDLLGLSHSNLTPNQRLKEWIRAKKGESRVMVGTRSALFTPFDRLGLVILDEEHDTSYKQDEGFRYHARDMAIMRAKMENGAVVLGSATPSLESYLNAKKGKYLLFHLPERGRGVELPKVRLVDHASQIRQTGSPLTLCRELIDAIGQNLEKKEQTLILLNRRGFARSLFCLDCQQPASCANCSVNLVYHRKNQRLLCHYCDYSSPTPKTCPHCQSPQLTLLGSGTETVEGELSALFPGVRLSRLDRDTLQKKGTLLETLKNLREHKIDILVGTQMIAKGHDVPNVTLVGVLGIDSSLGMPDFRAAERTFQLLTQVSGRAGRGEKPGQVIVQSLSPDHYAIMAACRHDYEGFFIRELSLREELNYPPIGRLLQFQFSSHHEKKLENLMDEIHKKIAGFRREGHFKDVSLLGPAPSPIPKLRGRFRWHLILKGGKTKPLQEGAFFLKTWLGQHTITGLKWTIDVDPIDML